MSTPSHWPHFSWEELTCHCGCGQASMDERLMEMLEALRRELGFPFPINSAYRCPKHDAAVGSSSEPGGGPHTRGRAVDIRVSGEQAFLLVRGALARGFTGIGQKQAGPWGGRYVHLDNIRPDEIAEIPRPRLWTYS